MIFIGGIGPRKKKLENQPRLCPNCGDYLSLFFIPIFRIRKGEPFIECDRCGHISDERGFAISPGIDLRDSRCRQCGANVEKDFKYCPYCGGRL